MFSPTLRVSLNYWRSMARTFDCLTLGPLAIACSSSARAAGRVLGRAFYYFVMARRIVAVHAFIKKSQ